jgi:uncharacterized protein (DUF1015 family)
MIMADIRPMKALRPEKDLADRIAALPYDVYSREEAYELVRNDSYSFLRIDRPETQFPPEHDMYAPEVYKKAGDMLKSMVESGEFVKDNEESYYIYSLTMDGRTQNGIVACASAADYENGVIKKHENTREDKLQDRIRHIEACSAQTGPVFLAYRRNAVISDITGAVTEGAPEYDFVSDGSGSVRHRVWRISDSSLVDRIRSEFARTDSIYIADGHHRCASAVRIAEKYRQLGKTGESQYFLSVLFPEDELRILPYNRVILDLNGMGTDEFTEKLGRIFDMRSADGPVTPGNKGSVGYYDGTAWYEMTVPQKLRSSDPVGDLDVSILQDNVFGPLLGIRDPRTDKRIDFVGGIRGTDELEKRCSIDSRCAFSMFPTSMSELMGVADSGKLMPPKSTWFEPKLLSGLFIHEI